MKSGSFYDDFLCNYYVYYFIDNYNYLSKYLPIMSVFLDLFPYTENSYFNFYSKNVLTSYFTFVSFASLFSSSRSSYYYSMKYYSIKVRILPYNKLLNSLNIEILTLSSFPFPLPPKCNVIFYVF